MTLMFLFLCLLRDVGNSAVILLMILNMKSKFDGCPRLPALVNQKIKNLGENVRTEHLSSG